MAGHGLSPTVVRRTTVSLQVYDDFGKSGYSLTNYYERWITPDGLGEMAIADTRSFDGGCLNIRAVPFRTGSDVGVADHLKYLAVSTETFAVPRDGTLVLSTDIKATTPGTVPDLTQLGVYGPSGSWPDGAEPPITPHYKARVLQGQQAGAAMTVTDFCTGQVFDWFIASETAFAVIERLPTVVTGNLGNPQCARATEVGISKMYTQIIREIPIAPGAWHHVDIALTRRDRQAWVDYFLDQQPVAHVEKIGIPLDKQAVPFTGIWPSAGDGETIADQLDSVCFGHGLFSLLDAFPFQHPDAPELSVSIPVDGGGAGRARLFGQGATASFGNYTTCTVTDAARPSEILSALKAVRA
jgi:hypothetical protein